MTDLNELYRQLQCGSIFSDKILGEPRRHQWRSSKQQTPAKKEPTINNGGSEQSNDDKIVKVDVTMDENRIRKLNGIHVKGKNIPKPIVDFKQLIDEFKISSILYENILKCDYKTPTPIQMQAIPNLISKQSTIGIATTGSGKTAAFLVPIINALKRPKSKGFRAMILCPTRELAKQTQRECLRLVDGGIDLIVHTLSKTNDAEKKYGAKSNKKYDILVTTPNRVCYLLSQTPPQLNLTNVKWLILDEADKLFQTGKNSFLDQFKLIYAECTNPKITIGLFSATTSLQVIRCFRKLFKPKKIVQIIIGERNSAAKSVEQEIRFTGNEMGKLMAFRELVNKGIKPPVLIFVDTKDRAEQLYSELKYDAINIDLIHGDRAQADRDKIVNDFREGKIWFLICTELISRGIDFKGINLVLNYDFPESSTSYIHRVGRAGRANLTGKALTFVTFDDLENLRSIARIVENAGGKVPEYMLKLKKKSKRDQLKSAKTKLKRDDICTNPDKKKGWKKGGKINTGKIHKNGKIQEEESSGKFVKINGNVNDQVNLSNQKIPVINSGNEKTNTIIVKNQIKLNNGNNKRKRKIEEKTDKKIIMKLNQQNKKKRKV